MLNNENEISGDTLKNLRKLSKMTMQEVSEQADISTAYLCQLENNKVTNASYKIIIDLLTLYKVKIKIDIQKRLEKI